MWRILRIRKYFRLNQNITAKTVRLLDKKGKQIGVVTLEEAVKKAREESLDLVEIAGEAKPPVVKIIDFKKFRYDQSRKEREARKKTREVDTKEIWLSPTISSHDLDIRLARAQHFLTTGDRVKLTVKFAGRQIIHPELGRKILDTSLEKIAEFGEQASEPKMAGRALSINVRPISKPGKNKDEAKN